MERYSGNPLALKLVAQTIQELFAGNIAAFLREETPIFDDIRDVLDQQFARLSRLERKLLIWLAIEREAVSLDVLHKNLVRPEPRRTILEAVRSLQRRSLLANGTLLASASGDQTVLLWDARTGELLHVFHTPGVAQRAVTFSPDGARLVSGGDDGVLRLWDTHALQALSVLRQHSGWVRSLAWSADGALLASASNDHTIQLWDAHTAQLLRTLKAVQWQL